MNNRYIFHGKRVDNGKWVKGALLAGEVSYIIPDADALIGLPEKYGRWEDGAKRILSGIMAYVVDPDSVTLEEDAG